MAKYYFGSDDEAQAFMKEIVKSADFTMMMNKMFPVFEEKTKETLKTATNDYLPVKNTVYDDSFILGYSIKSSLFYAYVTDIISL